jgi:hypothetical protein
MWEAREQERETAKQEVAVEQDMVRSPVSERSSSM